MDERIALPGAQLGASEEYAGGSGTFEEEGSLYASVAGKLDKDESRHGISVRAKVRVHPLAEGDTVLARVFNIYDQIASFLIERVENKPGERSAVSRDMVFIRIGEVQRAFTENLRDVLRIGDLVRGRVIEVKPLGTYITMKDSGLGVVQAYCSMCRGEMKGPGPMLLCSYCGHREPRKTPGAGGDEGGFERRRHFDRPMGPSEGRGGERREFRRFPPRGGGREGGGFRGGPRREGGFRSRG